MFGFVWRPGSRGSSYQHSIDLYRHLIDEGDLLKFWFRLKGRTSPGSSTLELTYYPTEGSTRPAVSVFAKWDETANPEEEIRREDGKIERTFRGNRVPATYFLPLRTGRIYTVPVAWARPPAYEREDPTNSTEIRSEMLLFSGWWFDPQRPRPWPVQSISRIGRIQLILSGEGLHWSHSFSVAELVDTTEDLIGAESDAHQADVSQVLPRSYVWNSTGHGSRSRRA